jgi:hypothetical protein
MIWKVLRLAPQQHPRPPQLPRRRPLLLRLPAASLVSFGHPGALRARDSSAAEPSVTERNSGSKRRCSGGLGSRSRFVERAWGRSSVRRGRGSVPFESAQSGTARERCIDHASTASTAPGVESTVSPRERDGARGPALRASRLACEADGSASVQHVGATPPRPQTRVRCRAHGGRRRTETVRPKRQHCEAVPRETALSGSPCGGCEPGPSARARTA